jgi:uncharacterized protein YuzE
VAFPISYPEIEPGIRRSRLARFPYGLIYGLDGETLVVVAVAHLHRRSRYWIDRILKIAMEAVKLFDKKKAPLDWQYDGDADILYISFGKPRPAVGVDVGEGVVVRYDVKAKEVVGLTIIGVGRRLEQHLKEGA